MKHAGDVLFLDSTHPLLKEELERMGYRCDTDPGISESMLIRRLPSLTGIIIRSKLKLDEQILKHGRKLRFVGRVGSGLENIDVAYAKSKGIACLNSPEGNRQAVGEHAAGMLLSLLNKICVADREVRQGIWEREANRGVELSGKTIGIIGYGNTGSAFARCMSGFGSEVIAYDKYKHGFGNGMVKEVTMQEIFDAADVLSLHVPLTPETKYMVNHAFLSGFRKDIFLINTSRGKVVKTNDLNEALITGKVRGAALDVLEYEHLSFEKIDFEDLPDTFRSLASMQNVILTPHVAGWTVESERKLAAVLARKIRDITL